ncbi:MAG: PfkB family carbohydrate kinase [Propionibacteriaceae bacterium]|jgi:fructokinase|nr:PfkB family carbohydrate kinase [Propionibacteriaceae bacterium]
MYPDILLIGEALIDIVRRAGAKPEYHPGGSPLNVAVGLGRLGHRPILATWFARDELGRSIEKHCADSQVRILPGSDQALRTPTADAIVDEDGHADYVFDIDLQVPPLPMDFHGLVHTGSIGALIQPVATEVLSYIENIRSAFITFDPNCRPSIMGDVNNLRPLVEGYVEASNLVKVSDEDLQWLYRGRGTTEADLEELAKAWVGYGPTVVIVTMGAGGALGVTQDFTVRVTADTSHGLVDTVGAGDSFMAGLIHEIITGGYTEDQSGLGVDPHVLTTILTRAAAMSGITVSRAGANPPWLSELGE